MPSFLRRTPLWADRLYKPHHTTVCVDYGHPLCPKFAWLLDWPGLVFPESINGAFPAQLQTPSDRPTGGVSPRFGTGVQFFTSNTSAGLVLGPEASLITANGQLSIMLAKRKTDTTVRSTCDFGILNAAEPGSFAHRCGANIPFGDSIVYWDYGGVSEPTSRLSVGGLTFRDDVWIFSVGARGMEIWQNGFKRASNAGTPTRTGTAGNFYLGDGQSATGTQVDFATYAFVQIYHRQLSEQESVSVSLDPYQWCLPTLRRGTSPPIAPLPGKPMTYYEMQRRAR